MTIDRRTFIQGGAAAAALPLVPAWAMEPDAPVRSFFADGPLATNRLAALFKPASLALPDVPVMTAQGPARLSRVGGKTRLLSLWAEWCVPCLVEIRDLAKLRPRYATDRFDIGLLMTATKLDRAQALARLKPFGAEAMPLLVETGDRAAKALATRPGALLPGQKAPGFSLPCTLLVDARGRVRARAFGAPSIGATQMPALSEEQKAALKRGEPVVFKSQPLTQADKDDLLARGRTIWSSPIGAEFLAALGGGLVDRM